MIVERPDKRFRVSGLHARPARPVFCRAGIRIKIGNHTFRARGIRAYLENGGRLESPSSCDSRILHAPPGGMIAAAMRSTSKTWRELELRNFMAEPSKEELLARIAELERQMGKKKNAGALSFKVSDKGAVSVYGMGRFPVTLYYEQWLKLLGAADELRAFLDENKSQLKLKEEA
jgi:hypothetical protein